MPREIEEAQMARDEAHVSFVEGKKRVAEIAKSLGFYPIVALAPEWERWGAGAKCSHTCQCDLSPGDEQDAWAAAAGGAGRPQDAVHAGL